MSANVKVFGFEWILNGGRISNRQLCDHLVAISGKEMNKKIIVVTEHENLYIGVVMNISDMASYCQIKRQGGDFTMSNETLPDGAKMADFNFFILNPLTMRGLYQYYHKSTSLNSFSYYIKQLFNEFKAHLIEKAMSDEKKILKTDELKLSIEKRIRSDHYTVFSYAPMLKPETFDEYVQKMSDITSLEFEVVTPGLLDEKKVAFSKYAKRTTHKVYFNQTGGYLSSIKIAINKVVKAGDFRRAKIKGLDPERMEVFYNLSNNTELFSEYDYDQIASHIRLESKDLTGSLKKSLMIKELLHLYEKKEVKVLMDKPWK